MQPVEEEFWSIERTMTKRKEVPCVMEELQSSSEEEGINLLEKTIKELRIN